MREIVQLLIPIIVILLSLAVWSLFVLIKSPTRPTVKAISIPLTIGGVFIVVAIMTTWLGRSVPLPLPDEVIVLAHNTVVKNGKKTNIEIWVKEKNATRLYIVLWTNQLEQTLGTAHRARQQGMQTELKKGANNNRNSGGQHASPGEWTIITRRNPDLPHKEQDHAPPGHPPAQTESPVAPQRQYKPDHDFMK